MAVRAAETSAPADAGRAALADTYIVVAGCLVFCITWILIAFGRVPCLPIGRAAGALLGAALMVATGVLTSDEVCISGCRNRCPCIFSALSFMKEVAFYRLFTQLTWEPWLCSSGPC